MQKIIGLKMIEWIGRRKNFLFSCLVTSMFFFIIKTQHHVNSFPHDWSSLDAKEPTQEFHSLTILSLENLPEIHPLDCLISYPHFGVSAKICVKKDDNFVSGKFIQEGAWEEENVVLVLKAMSLYEDAVFVDAGSNIGMFTILVAAMDRKVVAVDVMADNLAYIRRSLELASKVHLVTLAHNAVSDNHRTLYPVQYDNITDPRDNPGSLRVIGQDELLRTQIMPLGPSVKSVTLQDIFSTISTKTIILKMDIQGYECKALLTPGTFAPSHFIPYIFMEWNLITTNHTASLCSDLDAVIDLLQYNNYFPINLDPIGLLSDSCLHQPFTDLLWIHQSARSLWTEPIVQNDCV